MLPETISRRFTNTQIEVREPLRRELDILTAEYLARGGNVVELPNKLGTPRPIVPRGKAKDLDQDGSSGESWSEEELQAVRIMKSKGMKSGDIASTINAKFGNNRTMVSIKRICAKKKIYMFKPANRGDGWLGMEDRQLRELTAAGKRLTSAEHLAQCLGGLIGWG